jgi:hypothetical protein
MLQPLPPHKATESKGSSTRASGKRKQRILSLPCDINGFALDAVLQAMKSVEWCEVRQTIADAANTLVSLTKQTTSSFHLDPSTPPPI